MTEYHARLAKKLYELCKLSGLNPGEVKKHHAHSVLSIDGLLRFYAQNGCFPCEATKTDEGI